MIITDASIGKTASGAFRTAAVCRSSHSHSAACGARWTVATGGGLPEPDFLLREDRLRGDLGHLRAQGLRRGARRVA